MRVAAVEDEEQQNQDDENEIRSWCRNILNLRSERNPPKATMQKNL